MGVSDFLDMTIEQLAGNFMLKYENGNQIERFVSYQIFENAWELATENLQPIPTISTALIDNAETYAKVVYNDTAHAIISIQDLLAAEEEGSDQIGPFVQIKLGLAFLYVVSGSITGKGWEILSEKKIIRFSGEFFAEFEVTYPKMLEIMNAES